MKRAKHAKHVVLWSTPSTKTRQVHRARKYAKHVEDANKQARNLSDSIVSR